MKVGFIGTGQMGNVMAGCIIDAGHELAVFDIRREAADELVKRGAMFSDPKTMAANCDAVFASLPGPKQVEDVIFNKQTGMLGSFKRGAAYFDTTTSSPEVFKKVASALKEVGVDAMDTPVSGRPPQLTMMVGGDKAVFDKYESLFRSVAKNLFYVGETGTGCIAKLATQYLGYTYFVAATEAFLMAHKSGVNIKTLAEIIPVSAGRGNIVSFQNSVFKRNFDGPASLSIIAKDLNLACEVARRVQSPAFTGMVAKDIFERGEVLGWGEKPFAAAAQVLEQMAGAQLKAD